MTGSLAVSRTESRQIEAVVDQLVARDRDGELTTALQRIPARKAQWAPKPEWVRPELVAAYRDKGVGQLYSHQARAIAAVHEGRNTVIVTPTCDRRDIGTALGERPPSPGLGLEWDEPTELDRECEYFEPNLYIYDAYPGGIGFSEPMYDTADVLIARTQTLIQSCQCQKGCPSCVGPSQAANAKQVALTILNQLGAVTE